MTLHFLLTPVPLQPGILYADAPTQWPQLTAPGLLAAVPPADGMHRFLLPGAPSSAGWELLSGGVSLGHAHPCELSNGWDDAGELIRLPRRKRENDYVYAGRQQRLWLAAILNTTLGAAAREGQERTLSAALCLSVIVSAWDGTEFSLPPGTTRVDALDYPQPLSSAVLSLSTNQVIASGPTTLRSTLDLSSYRYLNLLSGDTSLRQGVDYILAEGDGTTLYLQVPLADGAALDVIGQQRTPFRLDLEEMPTLIMPEPSRLSSDAWQGSLLITRGPVVQSCDAVLATRLLEPGGAVPTALGRGITGHLSTPAWSTTPNINAPSSLPPFDLDMGVFS